MRGRFRALRLLAVCAGALVAPPAAHALSPGSPSATVTLPKTSPCPSGQEATQISRVTTLDFAAAQGALKLTAKGGYAGDVVAVDLAYSDFRAPVRVKVNLEVTASAGSSSDYASRIKSQVESSLGGFAGNRLVKAGSVEDGTPLFFEVNARPRVPGSPPTPCFHQVRIDKSAKYRSRTELTELTGPAGAVWASDNYGKHWRHEVLHLAGLDDQYDDFFRVDKTGHPLDGKRLKLPTAGMEPPQLKEFLQLKYGLKPGDGKLISVTRPGYENDVMGDGTNPSAKISRTDLEFLIVKGTNALTVISRRGDVLVNKSPGGQAMATGALFELTARRGGKPARAGGLVAYCIDARRMFPPPGDVFDVLGPATQFPLAQTQALQRVLDIAARRWPRGSFSAQAAIWRVTDNKTDELDVEAQEILREAGVAPDAHFEDVHFPNPNAGAPGTASVSTEGVKPATGIPGRAPPQLTQASLIARRVTVRGRRGATLRVRVAIAGGPDRVDASIARVRGGDLRPVASFSPRGVRAGTTTLRFTVPAIGSGAYVLIVTDSSSERVLPFTLSRLR